MKLLSSLWAVQTWARSQTSLRLYSSSLLMIYDARRLKNSLFYSRNSSNSSTASPNGSMSPASADGKMTPTSMFQWPQTNQLVNGHLDGIVGGNLINGNGSSGGVGCGVAGGEAIQLYKKLQRNHSTQNNYDEVRQRKLNYFFRFNHIVILCILFLNFVGFKRYSERLYILIG